MKSLLLGLVILGPAALAESASLTGRFNARTTPLTLVVSERLTSEQVIWLTDLDAQTAERYEGMTVTVKGELDKAQTHTFFRVVDVHPATAREMGTDAP